MNKGKKLLKRYRFVVLMLVIYLLLGVFAPKLGTAALLLTKDNLLEMLSILPPIFVLLGLLDVWVERETMMKLMGPGSGLRGGVLAFVLGSAAAGPLYAAFPIAAVLLKKGAMLRNVFLFIGAWSTTKIPMLLFEASNLSVTYMLLRLICNVLGIIVIAVSLERSMREEEKLEMYERAKTL